MGMGLVLEITCVVMADRIVGMARMKSNAVSC